MLHLLRVALQGVSTGRAQCLRKTLRTSSSVPLNDLPRKSHSRGDMLLLVTAPKTNLFLGRRQALPKNFPSMCRRRQALQRRCMANKCTNSSNDNEEAPATTAMNISSILPQPQKMNPHFRANSQTNPRCGTRGTAFRPHCPHALQQNESTLPCKFAS